jgi:hypothetical protein
MALSCDAGRRAANAGLNGREPLVGITGSQTPNLIAAKWLSHSSRSSNIFQNF